MDRTPEVPKYLRIKPGDSKQVARQKWVKALRSGLFKQGKGALYRPAEDSYCCLGVLGVIMEDTGCGDSVWRTQGTLYRCPKILRCVGLNDITGNYGSQQRALSVANDNGISFGEIANIIESEPVGLFGDSLRSDRSVAGR